MRRKLAALFVVALAAAAQASTVHCPDCYEFRATIQQAEQLKSGFESDLEEAQATLETQQEGQVLIQEEMAHMLTRHPHLRNNDWQIGWLLLEFEHAVWQDAIDETEAEISQIEDDIAVCELVIEIAESYISSCDCET